MCTYTCTLTNVKTEELHALMRNIMKTNDIKSGKHVYNCS